MVFADDIILIALGPKWQAVSTIFRLLAPTILVFGVINPTWWLLVSTGRQKRSLHMSFVIAPLLVAACIAGMPYGPNGVALSYSAAMTLWMVPHVFWAVHGTAIQPKDLMVAAGKPLLAGVVAALFALCIQHYARDLEPLVVRLALGGSGMLCVYFGMLLFALRQKDVYLELLNGLGISFARKTKS